MLYQNILKWASVETYFEPIWYLKHIQWYWLPHHWTHIVSCIQSMVCWSPHDVFWQAGTIVCLSALSSVRFWHSHLIMKTQVNASTKRVSVVQKWSKHGTCVEWEYESSTLLTYLCSDDFKRAGVLSILMCVHICFQRIAAWQTRERCTWGHLNGTWVFHNRRMECVH